ncbi:MAG: peptide/nickel transport system substrate-binding protein [Chloroflexota bacterium]|jgi:peptide/nickel transport system substrate-binding protein|nr:peptide/nickel transport system substrate-binding protein [Chloroflexota bacterium]
MVLLLLLACTAPQPSPGPSASPIQPRGGVLRVGMNIVEFESFQKDPDLGFDRSWDPAFAYSLSTFEIFRCCLVRNLMSYNGRASSEGGAELRPDIAREYPDISADGLAWTFHLKEGLMYAPPFEGTEILAADFVRSIERAMRPDPVRPPEDMQSFGAYANYLIELVAGAQEFAGGAATRISGLETPDEHTLVIHLLRPAGDLGARLAMPAFSALPPGAADGHDSGYGSYLAASGPYMVEGADQLDPSLPPDQQPTLSGRVPGERLILVRNPSWDPATDSLRSAVSDRIEILQPTDLDDVLGALTSNALDITTEIGLDDAAVESLRIDPQMSDRVYIRPEAAADWIMLNLAVPPFDDLDVRRAVNFAMNRRRVVDTLFPDALLLRHAIPDSFENDLLRDYDPYGTDRDAGSIELAMAEMRNSKYDTDHDGVCDAEICAHVSVPIRDDFPEVWVAAQQMASSLEPIGLHLDLEKVPVEDFFGQVFDPAKGVTMAFRIGWGSDYLNGSAWFGPLASGAAVGAPWGGNLSLLGATPEQLDEWGLAADSVPSLDDKIETCVAATGQAQFECWAQADQFLMERIAPWVPLDVRSKAFVTSSRIEEMVFDASTTAPSLDEIVVSQ